MHGLRLWDRWRLALKFLPRSLSVERHSNQSRQDHNEDDVTKDSKAEGKKDDDKKKRRGDGKKKSDGKGRRGGKRKKKSPDSDSDGKGRRGGKRRKKSKAKEDESANTSENEEEDEINVFG